VKKNSH